MLDLRSGVAAEIADAARPLIHGISKLPCRMSHLPILRVAKVPVLTEQAIEGTGGIEDREVLVAALGPLAVRVCWIAGIAPSRANPVADAVGGKVVIIPFNERFFRAAREFHEFPANILSHAAIADLSLGDGAGVRTNPAPYTAFVSGNFWGKPKRLMAFGVGGRGGPQEFRPAFAQAVDADTHSFGYRAGGV